MLQYRSRYFRKRKYRMRKWWRQIFAIWNAKHGKNPLLCTLRVHGNKSCSVHEPILKYHIVKVGFIDYNDSHMKIRNMFSFYSAVRLVTNDRNCIIIVNDSVR